MWSEPPTPTSALAVPRFRRRRHEEVEVPEPFQNWRMIHCSTGHGGTPGSFLGESRGEGRSIG